MRVFGRGDRDANLMMLDKARVIHAESQSMDRYKRKHRRNHLILYVDLVAKHERETTTALPV